MLFSSFLRLTGLVLCLLAFNSHATIVQFQTVLGNFEVNLYDERTPITVTNFLSYVNDGSYENNVIHRTVPGFIVQGGGFFSNDSLPLVAVPQRAPIQNEPIFSNRRGTIAMAKLGGNPNSATSQWFFNLNDNSANLDIQNSGFTAFGEVMGDGMQVVDAMAALMSFDVTAAQGSFSLFSIPLRDYTEDDQAAGVAVEADNLMLITNIVVLDAATDTASSLMPVLSTAVTPPQAGGGSSGSGGGSTPLAWVMGLVLIVLARRKYARQY